MTPLSSTTSPRSTAVSVASSNLEPRELMIARIAALAAVNAPTTSYLANTGAAVDTGVTLEDVQGILIAVAPIIGTPHVMSAAAGITEALGFVIAVAEAELEADTD